MNLLKLASAKFPPEQTPALLKDMEAVLQTLTPVAGATTTALNPQLRTAFDTVLTALRDVQRQLVTQKQYDSVLVDADFDDAGYGILQILDGKERVATARQIPLTEDLAQQLADVKEVRSLFILENAKEREIFSLSYQEEFNAVEIILARSNKPEIRPAIQRLGLANEFKRLAQCQLVLQLLLGIGDSTDKKQPAFARFETAIKQLIFAVGLYASEEIEEHKHVRETLLGAYERQVALYRERQKRHSEPKKQEAIPTTGTSTD